MSTSDPTPPQGREPATEAAEYVLGVLSPQEVAAFEQRLQSDPALRREVTWWESQLAPMAEDLPPEPVPPGVKKAVLEELFAGDLQPPRRRVRRRPIWFWQGATLVASCVAALLAFQLWSRAPDPVGLMPLGEISAPDDSLRLLTAYDAQQRLVQVTRLSGGPLPNRVLELWAIPEGGAPVSMGVLPVRREALLPLPPDVSFDPSTLVLAVSDEPLGGSPTGQPTGAVLATGKFADL